MEWYYADGDREAGPVSEAELDALVGSGRVRAQTLVWHDGMQDWQPMARARPGALKASPLPPVLPDLPVCSVCKGEFPREELIPYHRSLICSRCKPEFFQRLQEGAGPRGVIECVGAGPRLVAWLLDFGLVCLPFLIVGLLMILGAWSDRGPHGIAYQPFVDFIVQSGVLVILLLSAAYNTWMVGRFGATAGKMAVGAKVVDVRGAAIGYKRALARHCAGLLNWGTCCAGYVLLLLDDEKRGLHDRICETRVVRQ